MTEHNHEQLLCRPGCVACGSTRAQFLIRYEVEAIEKAMDRMQVNYNKIAERLDGKSSPALSSLLAFAKERQSVFLTEHLKDGDDILQAANHAFEASIINAILLGMQFREDGFEFTQIFGHVAQHTDKADLS